MIVSTERLGWPGPESSRLERSGIVQRSLVYLHEPDTPTACCHLQASSREPALCGFPWECLIEVPRATSLDDVEDWMRCDDCERAGQSDDD